MAPSEHDSRLDLLAVTPDGGSPVSYDELPVLDLDSDGPVSARGEGRRDPGRPTASGPAQPSGSPSGAESDGGAGVWLEGDVLMCECPDCEAPMSVRVWLMVADCWQCGTSIELTPEQEKAARRLLDQRQPRRQTEPSASPRAPGADVAEDEPAVARSPGPPRHAPTSRPTAEPNRQRPAERPAAPPSEFPHRSLTQPAPPRSGRATDDRSAQVAATMVDTTGIWIHDLFRDMPAWLVSLVLHLIMLTLLGLITMEPDKHFPRITLSLAANRHVREGDSAAWLSDTVRFDLPLTKKNLLTNDRRVRALIEAEQDAKLLRIDPDSPDLNLPDLAQVKQVIASAPTPNRTLALRDPRVRMELLRREGGTTLTEAAVARGLRWMAIHQSADGSWSLDRFQRHPECRGRCDGRGGISCDAAATSLVLLPFLGAGQTHLTGHYKDVVSAGLRWILKHQDPDGDLRDRAPNNAGMYVHGQATIVLCEALGMTRDEMFREPAQRAVDFIVRAQHRRGGWRYRPREAGDTSVLGWQLMALQSAKAAGLHVPEETLELAGHYLDRVQQDDGALYSYQAGHRPSPAMTAEGLLCRVYLGWKKDNLGLERGVDYLLENLPDPRHPYFYYWYYATQVMHHFGGRPWEQWNLQTRDTLVSTQETRGHKAGSWTPRGGHASQGGRLYVTSLAVCSLEVYYRHAPIFRQIRLD